MRQRWMTTVGAIVLGVVLGLSAFDATARGRGRNAPKAAVKAAPAKKALSPVAVKAKAETVASAATVSKEASSEEGLSSAPAVVEGSLDAGMAEAVLAENFPAKSDYITLRDPDPAIAVVAAAPVPAGEVVEPAVPVIAEPLSLGSPAATLRDRLIPGTLAMAGIICLLAIVWRRLSARAGALTGASLKVTAQQLVAPRSKIMIVEACGRRYLVGATSENISLIADMDFYGAEEEARDEGREIRDEGQGTRDEGRGTRDESSAEPRRGVFVSVASPAAQRVRQKLREMRRQ